MNKVELGKLETLEYSINEAYKTLRTNISFCGDDVKVILLTSCTPNEGKSTISMRLGQALAEDEKKVIIVLNTSLPSFFKENEETTITLWVYLSDLQ